MWAEVLDRKQPAVALTEHCDLFRADLVTTSLAECNVFNGTEIDGGGSDAHKLIGLTIGYSFLEHARQLRAAELIRISGHLRLFPRIFVRVDRFLDFLIQTGANAFAVFD